MAREVLESVSDVKSAASVSDVWDRTGLPSWTYFSEEFLALECDEVFRTHWQLVCHVNDVKEPGDFATLDIAGERVLVVRGRDSVMRAFHNLCRHRGSRVVPKDNGRCENVMVCPFHGWAYNLDGTLRGIAQRDTFPELKPGDWGLMPLEMEIWNGFVFVRFKAGPQPSVAKFLERFETEVESYGLAEMEPVPQSEYAESVEVNWKSVRDVDNVGNHVRQAHPALHDLYGQHYFDEPYVEGTSWSLGHFNDGPSRLWSVRNNRKILPEAHWLPDNRRRAWLYIGLFPNLVFGPHPDSVIFYQEIPVAATSTIQRGAVCRNPNETREMRLAHYLSGSIDRDTVEEDRMLAVWSCEAARSSADDGILLSDLEYGLRTFHDHLRGLLPVISRMKEPAPGMRATENARLTLGP